MADEKPFAFTEMTNPATLADDDWVYGIDRSDPTDDATNGSDFKMLVSNFVAAMQIRGFNRVKRLGTQHSISTQACTEVTDLTMALEAGTYSFDYKLLGQANSAATSGPWFNFNFDGTATTARWWFQYADLSATLLAAIGTAAHDTSTQTLGFQMAKAEDDMATTASGNMAPAGTPNSVQTTNTDILYKITGLIVVSVAGNMELWHGSETAVATSLSVGSSLIVVRTA